MRRCNKTKYTYTEHTQRNHMYNCCWNSSLSTPFDCLSVDLLIHPFICLTIYSFVCLFSHLFCFWLSKNWSWRFSFWVDVHMSVIPSVHSLSSVCLYGHLLSFHPIHTFILGSGENHIMELTIIFWSEINVFLYQ